MMTLDACEDNIMNASTALGTALSDASTMVSDANDANKQDGMDLNTNMAAGIDAQIA